MSKTHNEESITNCRKGAKARVHSSFSINEMYEPYNKENIERRYYK